MYFSRQRRPNTTRVTNGTLPVAEFIYEFLLLQLA